MFSSLMLLEKDSTFEIGANVTLSGIAIVFIALILLVLVISAFSLFFKERKVAKSKAPVQVAKPAQKSVAVINTAEDENEIIAVIAAAVDAMYSGSGKKAVIRSIRPVTVGGRPVWATAGIMENTKAF